MIVLINIQKLSATAERPNSVPNKNIEEEAGLNKTQGQLKPMRPTSWCESTAELLGEPLDKSVGDHIKWLARQKDYRTADGYEAQPYEQLARALRNDGRFEDAKRVTFEKLWLERKTIARGLTRGLLLFMEKWFDYGLFPCKSVMNVLCIMDTWYHWFRYREFRIDWRACAPFPACQYICFI